VFPEGTAVLTAALLKQVKEAADYRRILCVHLRAAFGEGNPAIAAKTGLSESTIRKVHAAFLRRGEAALTTRPRGGRRRAHLTVAEEAAVVQPFLAKAKAGGVVEIGPIQRTYEAKLGKAVAPSTVYRVLRRHGWRKIAPRPRHPRADPAAQQAFKKISPPSWPEPGRMRRRKASN
jgi:transposase